MKKPITISWPSIKNSSAYTQSSTLKKFEAAQKNGKPLRIAFLDIDSTLTGNPEDQKTVRQELEKKGYVITFVTSRTSELCMSFAQREKSSSGVQERPVPKLLPDPKTGILDVIDPASVESMHGLLDPDILASTTGAELLIKQASGGYKLDKDYMAMIPYSLEEWHVYSTDLLQCIQEKTGQALEITAMNDRFQAYEAGKAPIAPPPHRLQLAFKTAEQRDVFTNALEQLEPENVLITDDSEGSLYMIYLTPQFVHKRQPVDRVMAVLCDALKAHMADFEVLIAGDGPPDLDMGLHGAAGAQVTFVVPGGARINEEVKKWNTQNSEKKDRTVIIGDEVFPEIKGPQTLIKLLNQGVVEDI